ncbi:MAG: efflux transporter outer membrane subunit [Phycisphaerae bacterium]
MKSQAIGNSSRADSPGPGRIARAGHWAVRGAALCAFCAVFGQGCEVGPDYRRPATAMPAAWGEGDRAATSRPASLAMWWRSFQDPVLDRLIDESIAGNLTLRQAQESLLQARAQRRIAAAAFWPTVTANASYQRLGFGSGGAGAAGTSAIGGASRGTGRTATGGGAAASGGGESTTELNLFQAGFDATWELDVFGKVRRSVEAADATAAAAAEDLRNTLVSLLAEVATNYVQLRGYQRQLQIAKENLRAQNETLRLTREQFNAGAVDGLSVAQAAAQAATTAAAIPVLEASIRQTMHILSVLCGRQPMELAELATGAGPVPSGPPRVPAGLPSTLLRRRPDIRGAERRLAAATASIGVAVADLYPQFSFTAGIGQQSTELSTFFDKANRFWSFGPNMSWTIFEGGAIRANIDLVTSQQRQAAVLYQQTVLTAMQEVEDALVALAKERAHNEALAAAVEADRRTLELSRQLYLLGRASFLNVLAAQAALLNAQTALAQSDTALATDLVALYKALGGGWEGQTGVLPPEGRH